MSQEEQQSPPDSPRAASDRAVELAFAALTFAFGALVLADSWRIGARWGDDGPQAGYFPFYIALLICAASAWVFASALRSRKLAAATFLTRRQLGQILALLVPLTVYVVLIDWIGLYVASTIFVAYFMVRHGQHRWWTTAAVSVGVPVVFFLAFEIWFKVPLPKGPLEAALGLG